MHVTYRMESPRGKKYRISFRQLRQESDETQGVGMELQEWRERPNAGWYPIASGMEDTNTASARVLAGWLTVPMPNAKTIHEIARQIARRIKGEF